MGQWLEKSIKSGEHHQVWDMMLNAVQRSINEESTKQMLIDKMNGVIKEYKDQDFVKNIFINIAQFFKAVDSNSIIEKVINAVNEFVNEAKNNTHHPARQKFDNLILEFANKLANGDVDAQATINNLKKKLFDNSDANGLIHNLLIRFKSTMIDQLQSNDTPFMILLINNLKLLLSELESDKNIQKNIDVWMRETITSLIDKYHPEIGNMVRTSLSKLDDVGLVKQIEEKVGDDLQFIRLNGAVVGGLAGIFISIIKLSFNGN